MERRSRRGGGIARRLVLAGLLVALLVGGAEPAWGRRPRPRATPPPPPPYLTLAREAVLGGDLTAAQEALARARSCWARHQEACGFTGGAYRVVAGIVALELGHAEEAAALLAAAVEEQPGNLTAWFYLGQALAASGRPAEAAPALERARPLGAGMPGYWVLLARAHQDAGAPEAARSALAEGLLAHPGDAALLREAALLFLSRDLLGAVVDLARGLGEGAGGGHEEALTAYLLVAERLREAGLSRQAARVLEEARLLRPDDAELTERLAWTYAQADMPLVASRLFERLAWGDGDAAPTGEASERRHRAIRAAAEQYLLSDRPYDALRWTARLPEASERASLRAGVHLATGAWELALANLLPLWREGRLSFRDAHRLAHAALHVLRLDLVREIAAALRDSPLSAAAARLSAAARHCREQPASCL